MIILMFSWSRDGARGVAGIEDAYGLDLDPPRVLRR